MRRLLLATTAAAFCLAINGNAHAQTTTTATPAQATQTKLEDVTVTAQKRKQSLQKTAASVTVQSGAELKSEGKTQIGDILQNVVGVTISGGQSSPSQVYVRGIGPQDPNTTSQVAYVTDGISSSAGSGFGGGAGGIGAGTINFDIDQVEVARGPQGTSYGGNAGAGAVIINTMDPVLDKYAADATLETGSYALLHAEGAGNFPIADGLAARVAFYTDKHDGYFNGGLGDDDTSAGRVKLRYQPNDALNIVLTGEMDHVGGRPSASAVDNGVTSNPNGQLVGGTLDSNAWTTTDSPNQTNDNKEYIVRAKIIYNFPIASLTVLPYYAHNDGYSFSETGGNPGQTNSVNDSKTIEARLDSPEGQAWYWQLGAYAAYFNTPVNNNDSYSSTGNAAHGPGAPPEYYSGQASIYQTSYSEALFATTQYPVFDNLKLTGGLRWQDDRSAEDDAFQGIYTSSTSPCASSTFNASCFSSQPSLGTSGGYGEHWHNVTWKGGLDYQVQPNILVYGNAATGYSPGTSFDLGQGQGIANTGSQVLIQYAIGEKGRFFDSRLQFNAELYITNYISYNADYHLPGGPGANPNFPHAPIFATLKGSAYNNGGDVDISYLITDADRLSFQAAYDDSNYGTVTAADIVPFVCPGCEAEAAADLVNALSHHTFQYAPKWTLQPSYQHTFSLNNGASVVFRANTQYQTAQFTDNSDDPASVDKNHTKSNLYLTYNAADGKWSASAYVKNIENYAELSSFSEPPGSSSAQVNLDPPRTWGVVLNAKF